MNTSYKLLLFFLPGLILLACQADSQQADASSETATASITAFVHVNVIPMSSETILTDQTVLVSDGKITKIAPAKDLPIPQGATAIDGTGQYLMPGLAEMHAHIPVPKEGGDTLSLMAAPLFLYLANGITLIRGMLGHPYHLDLREMVMRNELPGPKIYTSGPSINGNTAPDPETARGMVREQKEAGYDFLKLHPGLTVETFDAIVATAKEVGIPYAGHVSNLVGIEHALANDYGSVDHIDGYLEGLVPPQARVDKSNNGFFGFNFVDLVDLDRMEALAQTTVQNGIAVVPTQSVIVRWTSEKAPDEMAKEPEMKYMNPRTVNNWKQGKYGLQGTENYTAERAKRFESLRAEMIKALHDAGVLLLLGSDSPQVFNVPGFSIHHELSLIAEAGLTPFEALQTGTVNPAKYFGEEGKYGVVAEGASADLILLTANPLEDLAHLHQRSGVMYRGTWLPESEIQEGLKSMADHYASLGD